MQWKLWVIMCVTPHCGQLPRSSKGFLVLSECMMMSSPSSPPHFGLDCTRSCLVWVSAKAGVSGTSFVCVEGGDSSAPPPPLWMADLDHALVVVGCRDPAPLAREILQGHVFRRGQQDPYSSVASTSVRAPSDCVMGWWGRLARCSLSRIWSLESLLQCSVFSVYVDHFVAEGSEWL